MLGLGVIALVTLAVGGGIGRRLAARGLTAENALIGRQGAAYAALATLALFFAALYFAHNLPWVPGLLVLYAEAGLSPAILGLATGSLGVIVALEWPGRRDPRRLTTMLVATLVLLLAIVHQVWRERPILPHLGEPRMADGVVLQTTSFSCAPAAIATLARRLGDTAVDERRAAEWARTTFGGTTALSELRALRRAGYRARWVRGLTPADLARAAQLAVLHVDEPVAVTTVRHAVALLEVDSIARTITIGNPLYGLQVKSWNSLPGYWLGDAILVDASR